MAKPIDEITWQELGIGAVVTEIGNSVQYKTGSWRSERPVVKKEHCIKCGVCWLFCPDMSIVQTPEGHFTANLEFCKGCGICAKECPVGCITMQGEEA
ncbi:MAG TPA: 4Fe-4S binding protein [Spirochaetota bacterium]|mgnify:CR=1 FL=1|nr:4Fe-4S binding protein [Spirochaetota bacterium]HNT11087.1 4Fe-4S binding protein [Spirochaetota bacterium]HNV48466.1 4Fe-4S binding protein [Spirochaetota bacterium]HOS39768.1 4Fe-4S binding protein [Spirochaetota bacterium]